MSSEKYTQQQLVPKVQSDVNASSDDHASLGTETEAIHAVEVVSMSLTGVISEGELGLPKRAKSGISQVGAQPLNSVAQEGGKSSTASPFDDPNFIVM
jgi:hypothetical protein